MDQGAEFSLEVLPPGSVINSHNFMASRKHMVNFRCLANCLLYTIKFEVLKDDIAVKYNSFLKDLVKQQGHAEANKARDQNPLDYIRGNPNFYDQNDQAMEEKKARKMHEILFALKNAVVFNLLKLRKDRKVKNLKDILEEYIKRKNKIKEAKRDRKKKLSTLTLEEKLEKLIDDDKILTQDQYESIQDLTDNIVKENLEANMTQLRLLEDNFNTKLMPKKKIREKANASDNETQTAGPASRRVSSNLLQY